MLDVVTFKWGKPGYRSEFTGEHVNIMARMVRRHYRGPVRFNCVTDDPTGVDPLLCRVIRLWDDFADVPSPHGGNNPSCFRRLKLWSNEVKHLFPGRVLQIDLDMVIVGDVTPLWDRPEPCVLWADNLNPTSPYNGAMQLITPGEHPVWECFKADPDLAISRARQARYFGSDQAQLALWLGPYMPRWTAKDGAVSWRVHCRKTPPGVAHIPFSGSTADAPLPPLARVVNFHGIDDPWAVADKVAWVAEHYR